MTLAEAIQRAMDTKKQIFTIESEYPFEEEIFFLCATKISDSDFIISMYDEEVELRDTEYENEKEQIKSGLLINKVTVSHDYREITEEEFNFLWELDYDEKFPELKEAFKYYDQVVYKQEG